ncbi:MAG: hypothetical protein U5M50_05035 [Sphingobium sp.]|nr:hypothetical protein [Sphingobium sp.]
MNERGALFLNWQHMNFDIEAVAAIFRTEEPYPEELSDVLLER